MRRTVLLTLIAAGAFGLAAPGTAPAQDRAGIVFAFIDRNGDGAISEAEIRAMRDRAFTRADANGDGRLTEAERAAAREARRARMAERMSAAIRMGGRAAERREQALARADADGDGVLTRSEFVGAEPMLLSVMDADGDGRVTAAEWRAAIARAR